MLDATHAPEPSARGAYAHHVPLEAVHQHSHSDHHGYAAADVTTLAASRSGTTDCATHVEQAVPAAPRQWTGACAHLGSESVSPIVRGTRIDLPPSFDVRPTQAPPRLAVTLRI